MKIAVASQNFRTVTPHAGKTRKWLVYGLDESGNPIETDRISLPKDMSIHEYSGSDPHPLFSMDVVIVGSCGDGFIRRMANGGVIAVVADSEDPLSSVKSFLTAQKEGRIETAKASEDCNDHHHHDDEDSEEEGAHVCSCGCGGR